MDQKVSFSLHYINFKEDDENIKPSKKYYNIEVIFLLGQMFPRL